MAPAEETAQPVSEATAEDTSKAKPKREPVTRDEFGFRIGTKRNEIGKMLLRTAGVTVAEIVASPIHTPGKTTGQYQLLLGDLVKAGKVKREKDGSSFRYHAAL